MSYTDAFNAQMVKQMVDPGAVSAAVLPAKWGSPAEVGALTVPEPVADSSEEQSSPR